MQTATISNGMTRPAEAIQRYIPWVDASTLANVVSCTLDVAHFIKAHTTRTETQRPSQLWFGYGDVY